ncbi:unnamed protein product [Didymodactylos carnosus]|nr:unnamed protein product [Didymodactylos carnosus]CAF4398948.1 unnamed protein product [Didymodactylos carnosus]
MQSASILGLGQNAVVHIETDEDFRIRVGALRETVNRLKNEGLLPICISATAGTTDFGSIDSLKELAELCEEHDIWLHVDAAYGGALILSDQHCSKLSGIERADSITVDFHKLLFQPISCSAFLLKEKSRFMLMNLNAEYLNPESNRKLGIIDLVYKSIQTTRRFDVLKPFLTLQMLGRKKMAEFIDYTIYLAEQTAIMIEDNPKFELAAKPNINTIVFRYVSGFRNEKIPKAEWENDINRSIKLELLLKGKAVVGQTVVNGTNYLKFTLMNPLATLEDMKKLLISIVSCGVEIEQRLLVDVVS